MSKPKSKFIDAKWIKELQCWHIYYQNGLGGGIYVSYSPEKGPTFDNLPDNFPINDLKKRIIQLDNKAFWGDYIRWD